MRNPVPLSEYQPKVCQPDNPSFDCFPPAPSYTCPWGNTFNSDSCSCECSTGFCLNDNGICTDQGCTSDTGGGTGAGCCSYDFQTCITWCGTTEAGCTACAENDSYRWLTDGSHGDTCSKRWSSQCTPGSCCPGLACVDHGSWSSCEVGDETVGGADPTASPTDAPSTDPTVSPTKAPTTDPKANTDPTVSPTEASITDPTVSPTKAPITDPTASPTDAPSTDPNVFTHPACCAGGATGHRAYGDCTQFYQCVRGVATALNSCGDGLLFDETIKVCNWKQAVTCNAENCVH
jgi:hypothetical protein